jgi:hypothetical protein
MTLLVAAVAGPSVWMIADAAVTGGDLSLRSREFELKVMCSRDGHALLGFAGDHHHGVRLLNSAAQLSAGPDVVTFLQEESDDHHGVELAYAYIDQAGPHLLQIAEGSARELPTLHLGVGEAFEHFQRVRLDPRIDPTPEAFRTFISGSRAPSPLPEGLSRAITRAVQQLRGRVEPFRSPS